MNFPTDYFSSRCNGRVEAALKACFWAICSFSTYGTALKCRNTCAWHRCKTLADALEEIPSVKSSPSYTIGCNTKMSSSLCKLLFEYELTRETLNVAYSARMIFFFFPRAVKLSYFISEIHWGLTNAGEIYKGNNHTAQSASLGNLVTI